MSIAPKPESSNEGRAPGRVEFAGDVLQQIRQHARSSMQAEICGVLVGDASDGVTRVSARIAGEGASQGGAHVTFTQDTWEHIYRVKDQDFPDLSIVGWYHSHPGFGIFLSDYDLFIHENFFNAPHQVAFVFDPHSDEDGCFGWTGEKVEPLPEIAVLRKYSTPTPEQAEEEAANHQAGSAPVARTVDRKGRSPAHILSDISPLLLVALLAFVGGFLLRPYVPCLLQAAFTLVGSRPQ